MTSRQDSVPALHRNPRLAAALAVAQVLSEDRALAEALGVFAFADARERALAREIGYGTLRWYPRLEFFLDRLLRKPMKPRDQDLRCALLTGLYQLTQTRIPPHAVVHETVALADALGKGWARGLINGVLRSYLRRSEVLHRQCLADPVARLAHPRWLLEQLQEAYPQHWERICEAANRRPPMTLRINARRTSVEDYLRRLREAAIGARPVPGVPAAVVLDEPVDVQALPGFGQGLVSVQDAAAQLAAPLLGCSAGMRVLDACAAPGGKTAHLLESVGPDLDLVALDRSARRLERMENTLARLGLQAELEVADGADAARWWDGRPFDRILLDAPCSATGIIRRRPEVKVRRTPRQLREQVQAQERLLDALWPLLRPGGMLLYATCSILPQENRKQMRRFCARQGGVLRMEIRLPGAPGKGVDLQILPGEHDMDGFYYALLCKSGGGA